MRHLEDSSDYLNAWAINIDVFCDDESLKERATEPWAAQRISDILGHKIPISDTETQKMGHIGMGRAPVFAPSTSDHPMKYLHICPS
jgi:hypothetical protein